MIDIDKTSIRDSIYLFRPKKGYYHIGKINKYSMTDLIEKRRTMIHVKYKPGKLERYRMIRRILPIENFSFKRSGKEFVNEQKFGSNTFTFRTKLEMLVFLDKYSRELCNTSLLQEIDARKRKESLHFI